MAAAGVEFCVAEALPGAQQNDAFSGLQFNYGIDVGSSDNMPTAAWLGFREQLMRQTQPGCVIAPLREAPLDGLPDGGLCAYWLEAPPKETSGRLGNRASIDVGSGLHRLGLQVYHSQRHGHEDLLNRALGLSSSAWYMPSTMHTMRALSTMSKPELVKKLEQEGVPVEEASNKEVLVAQLMRQAKKNSMTEAAVPRGVLEGQVLPETSVGSLRLTLRVKECSPITVRLPLLGITGARGALAAACSGYFLLM